MTQLQILQLVEDGRKDAFLAIDELERCRGALEMEQFSMQPIDYALKQATMALAWASQVRHSLETIKAHRDYLLSCELERARVADPTYTPSIKEVLENPDAFLDGFREG